MKGYLPYLLSLLLISNSIRTAIAYSWYILDIESFVEELCENKDTPQLQCNGKCYLSKLTIDEPTDEGKNKLTIEWEQLVYDFSKKPTYVPARFIEKKVPIFWYSSHYKLIATTSIFHPPRFS